MKEMQIEISLLSPMQLGSGQADIIIDSEAVHDEYGMPYFPAKRFKGLLYESAVEMAEMSCEKWFSRDDVDKLFGNKENLSAGFRVDNFVLPDYENMCKQWKMLQKSYPALFHAKNVWRTYTEVRYQTAIDKETGTAAEGSLRNMRVVDAGLKFLGNIYLFDEKKINQEIITKALLNLRYVGAKRNRGFGEVKCSVISVK